MGRIPEYQRSSFANTVQTSMISNAAPEAQMIGAIANAGLEIAQKQQRIQNETYMAKKSIELESRSEEVLREWQKTHEADPIGKEDDLRGRLSRVRDELLADAPTGMAQEEFGLVADRYYARVQSQATRWQDEQLKTNTATTAQEGLESLQVKMLRSPGPQNFDLLLQEGEMVLNPLREAAGSAVADEARKRYSQSLSYTMFEGLVEKNNLGAAQQLLGSQKYDEHLGADGIQKVQKLIEIKREQNNSLQNKLNDLKTKNPWEYYMHQGGVANPIAFNPSEDPSGGMLRDSILKRQMIVEDARAKLGIDLPMFTPQETDGLIKQLSRAGTRETVSFLSFYDKNITDSQKTVIAQQVFQKEPAIGIALSISNDAPEDAQRVISGVKLMRTDKTKLTSVYTPKPGNKDLDATFDTYLGNATEDAEFRRQLKHAATAHYTSMALNSDKVISNFDPELFQESIAAVSAPVVDINGRRAFSFRAKDGRFVDPDDLQDFVEDLSDEAIERVHKDVPRDASGRPINVQNAGDRVQYIPDQHGKYIITFDGRVTLNQKGEPFVVNLKDIYDSKPEDKSFWKRVWE